MAEEGKEPSFDSLKWKYRRFRRRMANEARRLDLSLDPQAKAARDRVSPVGMALKPYRHDVSLPKIMQVKAGEREFVSVRRFEGTQLEQFTERQDPESGDAFDTIFTYSYPVEKLNEGQIAVLILPCDYSCKSKQRHIIRLERHLK